MNHHFRLLASEKTFIREDVNLQVAQNRRTPCPKPMNPIADMSQKAGAGGAKTSTVPVKNSGAAVRNSSATITSSISYLGVAYLEVDSAL
jgi:hypothetical protein